MERISILEERKNQIAQVNEKPFEIDCNKQSTAGSVSQRACVFCGSRVVLYPITDALHLVHGPIGCASYTWDIRGALSSGPSLNRFSFCTDLQEKDIIYGGEKKLLSALDTLIERYKPNAAFVYATCIAGIIGDDIGAVCKTIASKYNIPVIPVHSEGFKGTKKDGYAAACEALLKIIGTGSEQKKELSVNFVGDFNVAGESWVVKDYLKRQGLHVQSVLTGDGRIDDIKNAHCASLNIVQCSGSMMYLAKKMKDLYDIPFVRASFFGIDDTAKALYDIADFFKVPEIQDNTKKLVNSEIEAIRPALMNYRKKCAGKKAAIYVGGAFKALSLVKALRLIGIQTVIAGTQTGNKEDYKTLAEVCDKGTVILDDSNPVELAKFIKEKNANILIGGVKERPIAYKLGLGFCDHNHERKINLAGFSGMINFAKEVYGSVSSPVYALKETNL